MAGCPTLLHDSLLPGFSGCKHAIEYLMMGFIYRPGRVSIISRELQAGGSSIRFCFTGLLYNHSEGHHLDSLRTLSWFVSYQRFAPKFQHSLSDVTLGIYEVHPKSNWKMWIKRGWQQLRGKFFLEFIKASIADLITLLFSSLQNSKGGGDSDSSDSFADPCQFLPFQKTKV